MLLGKNWEKKKKRSNFIHLKKKFKTFLQEIIALKFNTLSLKENFQGTQRE